MDYDEKYRSYRLDYPNDEVKYGFMESLAPLSAKRTIDEWDVE